MTSRSRKILNKIIKNNDNQDFSKFQNPHENSKNKGKQVFLIFVRYFTL